MKDILKRFWNWFRSLIYQIEVIGQSITISTSYYKFKEGDFVAVNDDIVKIVKVEGNVITVDKYSPIPSTGLLKYKKGYKTKW